MISIFHGSSIIRMSVVGGEGKEQDIKEMMGMGAKSSGRTLSSILVTNLSSIFV